MSFNLQSTKCGKRTQDYLSAGCFQHYTAYPILGIVVQRDNEVVLINKTLHGFVINFRGGPTRQ